MFLAAPTAALASAWPTWTWSAPGELETDAGGSTTMFGHPQVSGFMLKHSGLSGSRAELPCSCSHPEVKIPGGQCMLTAGTKGLESTPTESTPAL